MAEDSDNKKLLREDQTADYHVLLFMAENECKAWLQFKRIESGCMVSAEDLEAILQQAQITYGIDHAALQDLAEGCAAGTLFADEEMHLIAEGKETIHGEDGYIEFLVEPSPEVVRFEVDSAETIDYKNTNLIQNVSAEQHLAIIHQPQTPQNGINLFGSEIKAREGEPIKVKVGPNVTMDDDKIFATCNGRFIRESEELCVNPVFNVRGNVDLTIGNINFIGKVEIQKDVLDDFSVFGKEGVLVGGIVGAATLESEKDIVVTGGVNGKNKGFVRAFGQVKTRYLNETTVICREGAEIERSIMNSVLKTKGKVVISNGSIIGGEVMALMGLDAGSIGSDMGTKTIINVGVDYERDDKIRSLEARLTEIIKELSRINRIVGPLLEDKSKLANLSLNKKKALKGLLQQVKGYREDETRVKEELEQMSEESVTNYAKEIHVRKMLYSGVQVAIGRCKRIIKMEIKGPVCLREDPENETISITNLSL